MVNILTINISSKTYKTNFCLIHTCRESASSQDSVLLLLRPVNEPTMDFKAAPILLPGVVKLL